MEHTFSSTVTPTGIDYDEVYVYAIEMTSRDALGCAFGTPYEIMDYNENGTTTYSRYSPADCWVTNTTTGEDTIFENKARTDVRIDTYQDGFFNAAKTTKLSALQKRHPGKKIFGAILYPLDKSIVIYPLEILKSFPTKEVLAYNPEKNKYTWEKNHLVPVSDIDRVHNAGGVVRHWKGCDWQEMYAYNEKIGIELSERGLL